MNKVHGDVVHYMRVRSFWTFLIWAVAAVLASAAAYHFNWSHWVYWGAALWLAIIFIISILVRPSVYRRVTRYMLKEDYIVVKKGFFRVSTRMVPIRRVQGARLSTGPVSRKYDFAILEVKTASAGLVLPPLKTAEASMLKEEVIEMVKEEHTDV
ncbi:PH domain-containing protein [Salinicoccus hispanicus]|uniref:PH domain-containing protein n=1 Tax=Salinicoccus hispanicus TaxID=157225 RepID=A0A6N8U4D3_9STAP|nr:PH domain-containing protein [Salinicoccus hispanicus]MXQ51121.1 PH domain-containing protein [Salinicoccus hispanicus]